jgi:hypothetical protein
MRGTECLDCMGAAFFDTVHVFSSLARPKRVALTGSDGRRYHFVCKPKNDLRCDSRVMELYGAVNKQLRTDLASRRRDLHIRTYAALPLSDRAGLLEWVYDAHPLKANLEEMERARFQSAQQARMHDDSHRTEVARFEADNATLDTKKDAMNRLIALCVTPQAGAQPRHTAYTDARNVWVGGWMGGIIATSRCWVRGTRSSFRIRRRGSRRGWRTHALPPSCQWSAP